MIIHKYVIISEMGNVLKELNAICVCRKCLYNILKNCCKSKNKHYSPVSILLASTCASLKIVDSKDPMTQRISSMYQKCLEEWNKNKTFVWAEGDKQDFMQIGQMQCACIKSTIKVTRFLEQPMY